MSSVEELDIRHLCVQTVDKECVKSIQTVDKECIFFPDQRYSVTVLS